MCIRDSCIFVSAKTVVCFVNIHCCVTMLCKNVWPWILFLAGFGEWAVLETWDVTLNVVDTTYFDYEFQVINTHAFSKLLSNYVSSCVCTELSDNYLLSLSLSHTHTHTLLFLHSDYFSLKWRCSLSPFVCMSACQSRFNLSWHFQFLTLSCYLLIS